MDWNTLDEVTIKEREREYAGKYRKLYGVVDRLEKDPNLSAKQIMALPDLQFALNFFYMHGIMADYLPTGEIYKINTSERQKDGYDWLDMDWVWNKVVEFEDETAHQQARSAPVDGQAKTARKRKQVPDRLKRRLQKEVNSQCPFCGNVDVECFEIHHIDGNSANTVFENLIMLCPTCHAKIENGSIPDADVHEKKNSLKKGGV